MPVAHYWSARLAHCVTGSVPGRVESMVLIRSLWVGVADRKAGKPNPKIQLPQEIDTNMKTVVCPLRLQILSRAMQ